MRVKEIMQTPVTIDYGTSLSEASRIISTKEISTLFIIKDKELVGVVTKEDLVKHFGHVETVAEIMTKKVISITSDDDISEAAQLLKKNKLSELPVIDKKRLVGVISRDMLQARDEGQDFLFE